MFDAALVASGASIDVRWLLRNKGKFAYLDIDLDDSSNTNYSTSIGTYWETRLQTSTAALRKWLLKAGEERPRLRSTALLLDFALPKQAGQAGSNIAHPLPFQQHRRLGV